MDVRNYIISEYIHISNWCPGTTEDNTNRDYLLALWGKYCELFDTNEPFRDYLNWCLSRCETLRLVGRCPNCITNTNDAVGKYVTLSLLKNLGIGSEYRSLNSEEYLNGICADYTIKVTNQDMAISDDDICAMTKISDVIHYTGFDELVKILVN